MVAKCVVVKLHKVAFGLLAMKRSHESFKPGFQANQMQRVEQRPLLLLLLQSDILQVPVQRPKFQETTALGAALAAGLTVGFWDGEFLRKHPEDNHVVFQPAVSKEDAAKRFRHWQKAVSRCLDLADLAM